MKKLFLLTVALLGCTVAPVETPEAEPISGLDPQLCIDHSGDPTMVVENEPFYDGAGQFSMSGRVMSEAGEAPFSGETVEYVYLVVANDDSSAFGYFYDMAESGKIDKVVEGALYLKLGVLEEGESLDSSAYLSADTEFAILSALNSGDGITLNMLAALTLGKGAYASSVNPCLIEVQLPE